MSNHLWISYEWFIPVDDEGRCVGTCAEGALGFVVQLQHFREDDYSLALKLPKLTGETHRENAYINDLMEKELRAAEKVFFRRTGSSDGLLPAIPSDRGPLRGKINTQNGLPDAQLWHDAIVLVNFEKGKNPRFLLVKKTAKIKNDISGEESDQQGGECVDVFPKVKDCPITDPLIFEEIERLARSSNGKEPWFRTVFIEIQNTEIKPSIFNKEQALQVNPTGVTWYACIPSVEYFWAPGTLQEAISLNKRGNWKVSHHFLLMQRICRGLSALHKNKMLHADLRPANIAYRGNANDPNHFEVCDYGSFADTGARAPESNPTGGTVLGPVAGTERTSVFYAPERRVGRERESSDIAVIQKSNPSTVDIVLGWQSTFRTIQLPLLGDDIQNLITELSGREVSELDLSDSLFKGDRIQIRDYIFDVIKAEDRGDKQILICKPRSWKIYQGRIVVENTDNFEQQHWLPLPRTVELQQWSAATDLYSIGVLFLYSVYRNESPELSENSSKIEEKFREMLSYLESKPYFNIIWPELEHLRYQLEDNLNDEDIVTSEQLAEQPFNSYILFRTDDLVKPIDLVNKIQSSHDSISQFIRTKIPPDTLQELSKYTGLSSISDHLKRSLIKVLNQTLKGPSLLDEAAFQQVKFTDEIQNIIIGKPQGEDLIRLNRLVLEESYLKEIVQSLSKKREGSITYGYNTEEKNPTLKDVTINLVRRITQTVPWSRRLVEVFDFNLGPFIFFIHFVLCCLHRQNHLNEIKGWNELPFCENRIEPPSEDGGAKRALDRIEAILNLIQDKRLISLKTTSNRIPEFDPRSDPLIRAAYYLLAEEAKEVVMNGSNILNSASWWLKVVNPLLLKKLAKNFNQLDEGIQKSQSPDLTPIDIRQGNT